MLAVVFAQAYREKSCVFPLFSSLSKALHKLEKSRIPLPQLSGQLKRPFQELADYESAKATPSLQTAAKILPSRINVRDIFQRRLRSEYV
jgi:hypothetical protein